MKRGVMAVLWVGLGLSIAIMLLAILPMLYWSYRPLDLLNTKQVRLVTPAPYKQGQVIELEITYDKVIDSHGEVTRMLKNKETGYTIAVIGGRFGNLPHGINKKARIFFQIPVSAPPQKYVLITTARYVLPYGRQFFEDWTSPEFEVVE